MKRIILIIISIFALSISYAIGQTHNEATTEDTIKPFLTKMYNDKLYENYDFLQKHCSPELLKKLQDAYTYDSDGPAYATWLFRSGQQDSKPGSSVTAMPALVAPKFRKDILLVVGSEDNRTPQWMSEKIYNALSAGINKKLSVYEGAGHGGTEFPFFVDWGRWAEETVGFMLD